MMPDPAPFDPGAMMQVRPCAGDFQAAMRELPWADLDMILPGTGLILAPHADDESLGCGGLIAEACHRGRPPVVVILTDGTQSHPRSRSYPAALLQQLREQEAAAAVAVLGLPAERLLFLRQPDTALPSAGPALAHLAQQIVALAGRFGCGSILASWAADPHCDHLATARIAAHAAAQAGLRHVSYPVWGWTLPPDHHLPLPPPCGWRLAIDAHAGCKRQAIAAHRSQHGGLITDDPAGFILPDHLLAQFRRPYEVFLHESP